MKNLHGESWSAQSASHTVARKGVGKAYGGLRAAIYVRAPSADRPTQAQQLRWLREHAKIRGWTVVQTIREPASGAKERPAREELMAAARTGEFDVVLVWRLDRWGRSLSDLVSTLLELQGLGVGFVSLSESLDLMALARGALSRMIAALGEFDREIRRERVSAGIEQARREGRHLGRPRSAALKEKAVMQLFAKKVSQAEIARRLGIARTSVRRIIEASS